MALEHRLQRRDVVETLAVGVHQLRTVGVGRAPQQTDVGEARGVRVQHQAKVFALVVHNELRRVVVVRDAARRRQQVHLAVDRQRNRSATQRSHGNAREQRCSQAVQVACAAVQNGKLN